MTTHRCLRRLLPLLAALLLLLTGCGTRIWGDVATGRKPNLGVSVPLIGNGGGGGR
ncbi:hypothetical protein [Opitutus sp. ER46]|uniref:hypothetical protein n=1 Tax=Opitutus sp. ER46 TaxID=2161864 RepID=UPI001304A42F|nr:hypothetical protein [Opitutus sp. ER46]